jgi:hypothetical protein
MSDLPREGPSTEMQASRIGDLVVAILGQGRYAGLVHLTDHCRRRTRERGFDMADVESVVGEGTVIGRAQYCEVLGNWKYNLIHRDSTSRESGVTRS